MQLSAIMVRGLPKSPSAFTISPSPENRCLLSSLSLYLKPLQEFFFLKWCSAFLYYLIFEMHPFLLLSFSTHFSICLFLFLYLLYLQSNFLQNVTQHSSIIHFFFEMQLPFVPSFSTFLFFKEVSHFFFHSSRQIRCMSMKEGGGGETGLIYCLLSPENVMQTCVCCMR